MRIEWDPEKDRTNRRKHDLGFDEARVLFDGDADYLSYGHATRSGSLLRRNGRRAPMTKDEIKELTPADLERAIPRRLRDRLVRGNLESGADVAALRRFTGLSQASFALALGISVHTLRNWEQGRRMPEGPALALLRIVARHPRVLRENLALAG